MAARHDDPGNLGALERFFSSVPSEPTPACGTILAPVLELQHELRRPEFRVTLFGAVKTGKTSLLNRLLGAGVLPEHALRSAEWVTTVTYGTAPDAMLVGEDGAQRPASFDGLRRAGRTWLREKVHDIRVMVPLPVLQTGLTLVDTPGLPGEETTTERVYSLLERADLAVMVLAADKLLSAEERSIAGYVQGLLSGNIVFIVNRVDLVDSEDRGDVLEWARVALRGMGNRLTGGPRILVAARTGSIDGWDEPARWLAHLSRSREIVAFTAVSRAAVLGHRLARARHQLAAEQTRTAEEADRARLQHLERTMMERAAARHALGEARRRLETVHSEIPGLGKSFVQVALQDTLEWVRQHPGNTRVVLQMTRAVDSYANSLNEKVSLALAGAPITARAFTLESWLFRPDFEVPTDRMGALGGAIGESLSRPLDQGKSGKATGQAMGSWISKNVLGRDAASTLERRLEGPIRAALGSIESEAHRYATRMFELLDESDQFYQTWAPKSAEVDAAEAAERQISALLQWCEGFERATQRVVNAVLSPSQTAESAPPRTADR